MSNDILDDRTALQAAWDRDGYWFFRDVLDTKAVGRLRRVFLDELSQLGVIAPDDPVARYNGKSLDDFPFRMESLASRKTSKLAFEWHAGIGRDDRKI